jgi:putative flavoprotein involved in K+ transport
MTDSPMPAADVQEWSKHFAAALAARDADASAALFEPDGFWRDLLCFTWNLVTLEGRSAIADMLHRCIARAGAGSWRVEAAPGAQEGWLQFETEDARSTGYVRLRNGRAFMLLTAMTELKGHEAARGRRRPLGLEPDPAGLGRSWGERRAEARTDGLDGAAPEVLIVGASQAGLALGARLKSLGVPALLVDKLPRIGDQWRSRYRSLVLHDPVWYDHLPYLPFPDTWPVYTPKDKIADFLEHYASIFELDVATGTACEGAAYDEAAGRWTVALHRDGKTVTVTPRQLVLAVGNAGFPRIPSFPGAAGFDGPQLHSSAYRGKEDVSGKRVVVIGSNNSAHDICADLVERGAAPVMLQRSSTLVVRAQTAFEWLTKPLYSEEALAAGLTTERADLYAASVPLRVLEQTHVKVWQAIAEADRDFYDRLRQVGFMLDFGEDGTGMYCKYLRSASGYYIDVGASAMIADGRIGLRSQVGVEAIEADAVRLTSGERVPADMIVYATGFGSMEEWAATLISPQAAATLGRCWGYGSGAAGDPGPWRGEINNMWKPTPVEALWFQGGNLAQSRHFSKYLALQLQARMLGLAVEVYDPRRPIAP